MALVGDIDADDAGLRLAAGDGKRHHAVPGGEIQVGAPGPRVEKIHEAVHLFLVAVDARIVRRQQLRVEAAPGRVDGAFARGSSWFAASLVALRFPGHGRARYRRLRQSEPYPGAECR